MKLAEGNPIRLFGVVHGFHMREVFHLYRVEHVEGVDHEAGIEIEVRDAELIAHLDGIESGFLFHLSRYAFFAGFIHVYKSARQIEGTLGWFVLAANYQQLVLLVEDEGNGGAARVEIIGEAAVLALLARDVVDLEVWRAANGAELEFI